MNNKIDITRIKNYLYDSIWQSPVENMQPMAQKLVVSLRIVHLVIRDLIDGMINLRAMGLVYTTILALVPLLAVSFSVLKGFGVQNQIEPLLLNLFLPLGEKGVEVTERIIGFVNNTKAGVLGSLGLLLLMYTVVSLLQKIERAFNYTWRVAQHRPITQRFSDYITLILIGPILLFSALGMTASLSSLSMIQQVMQFEAIGSVVKLTARLIPYALVISAFTLVYILVPNIKVKFRSALIGGFVAGTLWESVSWGFTAFIVNSTKYTAIYSAFATMIIFFIWIYLNWLILLIGCSITSYHQQPSQRTLRSRVIRLSNRIRESMSLLIMALVARNYFNHQPSWSIESLAEKLHVGTDVCELLVCRLVSAHILVETSDTPGHFIPAYDMSTIMLVDIFKAVREAGESDYLAFNATHSDAQVDELFADIESAIHTSLQDKTLLDLARGNTKAL